MTISNKWLTNIFWVCCASVIYQHPLFHSLSLSRGLPLDAEGHLLWPRQSLPDSGVNPCGQRRESQGLSTPPGHPKGTPHSRARYITARLVGDRSLKRGWLCCVSLSPWLCGRANRSSVSSWSPVRNVRSRPTSGPRANSTAARERTSVTTTHVSSKWEYITIKRTFVWLFV